MPGRPTVTIRFSAAEIAARVDVMAGELAARLPADTLVVSVLKGSFVFAADLIRALSRAGADWSMDFLTLSSYGTKTETTGRVRIVRDIVDDVRQREVLLVDDILESGLTLSFAREGGLGRPAAADVGSQAERGLVEEDQTGSAPLGVCLICGQRSLTQRSIASWSRSAARRWAAAHSSPAGGAAAPTHAPDGAGPRSAARSPTRSGPASTAPR